MSAPACYKTESSEIFEILSMLGDALDSQTIYLYRTTLSHVNEQSPHSDNILYRGIVLCSEKSEVPPLWLDEGSFNGRSILIWGSPITTNIYFRNIEFTAKMTCMTIATLLTLHGIEVHVQNVLFSPEKGIE